LLTILKKIANRSFVAPFYHTISDDYLPHVGQLYKVKTIQQFKDDLDYLLKYFKPIDLQSLHKYIEQHAEFPKNTFFLSFDDGFSECETIIAPILKEKGIPATFFINSAFVDNRNLMYRCKASLLVNQLTKGKEDDLGKQALAFKMMQVSYDNPQPFIYFAKQLNVSFRDYLYKKQPYLSSKQIKNLHKQGFDIGSHSHDHPWFRDIPNKQQERQVTRSLSNLRRIVPAINSFSFPFSDDGITATLLKFIYNQNITLTFACAGVKQDETLQHIQRLPMELNVDAKKKATAKASQILPKAFLKYIMKKIVHKHKVTRPSLI